MSADNSHVSNQNFRQPYLSNNYDTKGRFISYWYQIKEVIELEPNRILEIGIGSGLVNRYIKRKGINVTTLDIDFNLKPDIAGSVLSLPLPDGIFDVVSCCQVLEHLPYTDFGKALDELSRVSCKYLILSLPDVTTVYRFDIELPRLKPIRKLMPHPFPRPQKHIFNNEHYWEIGKKGYPLEQIETDIVRFGLTIKKSYRVFEYYYHRFFLLEKKE